MALRGKEQGGGRRIWEGEQEQSEGGEKNPAEGREKIKKTTARYSKGRAKQKDEMELQALKKIYIRASAGGKERGDGRCHLRGGNADALSMLSPCCRWALGGTG